MHRSGMGRNLKYQLNHHDDFRKFFNTCAGDCGTKFGSFERGPLFPENRGIAQLHDAWNLGVRWNEE
jgi:hypothetical protein